MHKHIILTLAALTLAVLMFAQPGNNPMVNHNAHAGYNSADNPNLAPRPHDMNPMEELKLNDTQKKKLDEFRSAHQKSMNLLDAEIENMHIDIMQAMKKEEFANAKKLTQQLFEKKLAKANARIDHLQMVMKELTPEQKEMGRDMLMNMGNGDGKGMHKGMMNCPHMKGMKGMKDCEEMKGMQHDCMNKEGKPDPNMPTPKVKTEIKN